LISRDVAEHLAATPAGCVEIMRRCAEWFGDQGLAIPPLYVPPAWALGSAPRRTLGQAPFSLLETQTGVLDTTNGFHYWLPLVGFESDTMLRSCGLRCSNAVNRALAFWGNRPLRVALHPRDLELRLHQDVLRAVSRSVQTIHYTELPVKAGSAHHGPRPKGGPNP
jgi:hypothetical protein